MLILRTSCLLNCQRAKSPFHIATSSLGKLTSQWIYCPNNRLSGRKEFNALYHSLNRPRQSNYLSRLTKVPKVEAQFVLNFNCDPYPMGHSLKAFLVLSARVTVVPANAIVNCLDLTP